MFGALIFGLLIAAAIYEADKYRVYGPPLPKEAFECSVERYEEILKTLSDDTVRQLYEEMPYGPPTKYDESIRKEWSARKERHASRSNG